VKILITGGAGFIGGHLVTSLAAGKEVTAFHNLSRGRWPGAIRRCRFVGGYIRDREALEAAMSGIDVVFHLAAQSNVAGAVTDLDYSFTTNVAGTFEVLRAAKQAGVRRLVFASSREVYGDADSLPVAENAPLQAKNAYGASKVAGELYCRVFAAAGLEVNILRLANVYGPGDRDRVIPLFLENALAGQPLRINGGRQVIDFVWVDTVVEALKAAAFGPLLPGPVNIGSGKGTTLSELVARVFEVTGSHSTVEMLPARSFETVKFVADIGLAERLLGIVRQEDPLFGLARMSSEPASSDWPPAKLPGA